MSDRLAGTFDHAVLSPLASGADVEAAALAGRRHRIRGLCVLPIRVREAAAVLEGSPVRTVAVVGFPTAGAPPSALCREAEHVAAAGAVEIDLVLPWGRLLDGAWVEVAEEVRGIRSASGDLPTKLIVEASALTDAEILAVVDRLVVPSGSAFLKTGTGVYGGPIGAARVRAIRDLLSRGSVRLKVAGGIGTLRDARATLAAGADVLGSSRTFAILREAGESDDVPGKVGGV